MGDISFPKRYRFGKKHNFSKTNSIKKPKATITQPLAFQNHEFITESHGTHKYKNLILKHLKASI